IQAPYNTTTQTLTSVPESGVYWFQLAAGVPGTNTTDTRLNGLQYPVVTYSTSNLLPDDVMTTDTIQFVNSTAQLTVTNQMTLFGYAANGYMGTCLLGIRLDTVMDPLSQVYFALQLTQNATVATSTTPIPFDRVLINVGNGWNPTSSAFKAPSGLAGTYFF